MQLDLFSDPLPSMNPNKNPMAPDCFRGFEQYSEWLRLARLAKEECTICEDCIHGYKEKMKVEGRCHFEWHSVNVFHSRKPLNKPSKVKKEIEHEKLFWEFLPSGQDSGPNDKSSGC